MIILLSSSDLQSSRRLNTAKANDSSGWVLEPVQIQDGPPSGFSSMDLNREAHIRLFSPSSSTTTHASSLYLTIRASSIPGDFLDPG